MYISIYRYIVLRYRVMYMYICYNIHSRDTFIHRYCYGGRTHKEDRKIVR